MPNHIDLDDDIDEDEMADPADHAADIESPNALRRAAKAGKAAKAEAQRLAREVAFLKAGIDTDSPLGAMFAKGYEGELTKDAVTAAFSALGVSAPAAAPVEAVADDEPSTDTVTDPSERKSTAERSALANGSVTDNPANSNPDPFLTARQTADAVVDAGGSREAGLAAALSSILASDDPRTFVKTPGQ